MSELAMPLESSYSTFGLTYEETEGQRRQVTAQLGRPAEPESF